MTRLLLRLGLTLAGNAIGIFVAALLLDDLEISGVAFLVAVAIFTALEALLMPFVSKTTSEQAPILENVGSLITTFVALLITAIVSDGLHVDGTVTWVLATLIVWLATMIAGWLLPKLFLGDTDATQ